MEDSARTGSKTYFVTNAQLAWFWMQYVGPDWAERSDIFAGHPGVTHEFFERAR